MVMMKDTHTEHANILSRLLAQAVMQSSLSHGAVQTPIPFFEILKEDKPSLMAPGILKPSLCILLQGRKKLQAGAANIEYSEGDFMATSVSMPVHAQVVEAAPNTPYLALRIELTPSEVATVALEANLHFHPSPGVQLGLFVGKPRLEVLESFEKLLRLTADGKAAQFLAPAVKREIIYWLLEGENGALFYKNMLLHQEASSLSKIIEQLTIRFDEPITIEEMAELGNMSVSNLHAKFKEVTGLAPLQYQKRLRLQEARRVLLDGANVSESALRVGYVSASQFIREYKRLFGRAPLQDIRTIYHGEA